MSGIREGESMPQWDDSYLFRAYDLSASGLTSAEVRRALKIRERTWKKWLSGQPLLRKAVDAGRARAKSRKDAPGRSFLDFVAGRLPPECRDLWGEIKDADQNAVDAALAGRGDQVLMWLWLHALVCSNFVASRACAAVGVSPAKVERWRRDEDFDKIVKQLLDEGRKDFVEEAVMDLIARRDSPTVNNVAKSLLRDRGYGRGDDDSPRGGGAQILINVDVGDLCKIPVQDRERILDHVRAEKAKLVTEGGGNAQGQ
jgi:hypothetical protein